MNPSFQERFEALRLEWRRQLPQCLQETQQRLAACRADPGDADGLRELHRMLHTLAGSARTFGLDALGEQAGALEHGIDALRQQPARAAGEFDALQAQLNALQAAAPRD